MNTENTNTNAEFQTYAIAPLVCKNNHVALVGRIVEPFHFSHEVFGEGFFASYISVCRKSEAEDVIPFFVSERLIPEYIDRDLSGKMVKIEGEFRSFNSHDGTRSHLILSVFVKNFELLEDDNIVLDYYSCSKNEITLHGTICKTPTYRTTPLGREVTDILLAVNRNSPKSDYLPCICWGRAAKFASLQPVGTQLKLKGRIQSRVYKKKLSETEAEDRVAYEVSVSIVEKIDLESDVVAAQ